MTKSISILTYSQCPELYVESELLTAPYFQRTRLVKSFKPTYVSDLINHGETDWIIHMDEDAFLLDPKPIFSMIDFMSDNDYVCCGMPDGGVVPIRVHNPVACNPFFLILNRAALISKFRKAKDIYALRFKTEYKDRAKELISRLQGQYECDEYEPYYPFFYWLWELNLKILYLPAIQWQLEEEQISTMLLDLNNEPFLLHTWYSRMFMEKKQKFPALGKLRFVRRLAPKSRVRGEHFDRINRVIEFVRANENLR